MEDATRKVKGFFERPEGKTGLIFIFIGVLAFLFAGNYIMPFVITALQNTLHAMALGAALLAVVGLAMNKKFRFLCSSVFKSVMRWLTGLFITIDPIGILKNYIEDMKRRLDEIAENISRLIGQKNKLIRSIEEEKRNAEKAARLAAAAQKQGNKQAMAINARKVARSKEFVGKLEQMQQKIQVLEDILKKMRSSVEFLHEDTVDQVRLLEMEYKSIKAAHKAMKAAERLIHGDEAKELFEQTCEFVAEDVANKLGEMEMFMELSENFMTNVDLQNGVWDEEGMKMIEELDKKGSIFYEAGSIKETGKVRVATDNIPATNIQAQAEAEAEAASYTTPSTQQQSQFGQFFKS